jgi:hypothetical protein
VLRYQISGTCLRASRDRNIIRADSAVQLDLVPRDTIPAVQIAPALFNNHTAGNTGWLQSGRAATFEANIWIDFLEQPHTECQRIMGTTGQVGCSGSKRRYARLRVGASLGEHRSHWDEAKRWDLALQPMP